MVGDSDSTDDIFGNISSNLIYSRMNKKFVYFISVQRILALSANGLWIHQTA